MATHHAPSPLQHVAPGPHAPFRIAATDVTSMFGNAPACRGLLEAILANSAIKIWFKAVPDSHAQDLPTF